MTRRLPAANPATAVTPPLYLLGSVLYALRRNPDGCSAQRLAHELDEPHTYVLAALGLLARDGKVDQFRQRRSAGAGAWHLRPTSTDTTGADHA